DGLRERGRPRARGGDHGRRPRRAARRAGHGHRRGRRPRGGPPRAVGPDDDPRGRPGRGAHRRPRRL
ncbi:MAG: hypothetical protein AVDCRST_MAG79-31, partial [uncultured Thermoleophilia bacterium]